MKIYNSFDLLDPNRTVQLIPPLADATQPCRKAEASKPTVNWLSQSLTSRSSVDLKFAGKKTHRGSPWTVSLLLETLSGV